LTEAFGRSTIDTCPGGQCHGGARSSALLTGYMQPSTEVGVSLGELDRQPSTAPRGFAQGSRWKKLPPLVGDHLVRGHCTGWCPGLQSAAPPARMPAGRGPATGRSGPAGRRGRRALKAGFTIPSAAGLGSALQPLTLKLRQVARRRRDCRPAKPCVLQVWAAQGRCRRRLRRAGCGDCRPQYRRPPWQPEGDQSALGAGMRASRVPGPAIGRS